MKYTFLINSLSSGGAEKVLSILANELSKEYEVEVVFLEKNEFYELNKKVKKTYLSNFDGTEGGIKKLFYLPFLAWKLKKYILRNDIRLIQSHVYRANYVNVLANLFGAKHKTQIVTAGQISRYKELGLVGKVNLTLIGWLYKKADLLILKSYGMQKDMQKLFDFKVPQIVINNPYDIELIEKLSQEEVEFEFKKEKKYLISVGRLIELKRNHEIIEVLEKIDKDVELIFLGNGEKRIDLENLAKKLNLRDRVHFIGRVINPYKYISKSDILVSCSESEGFPNVLVEAMICKTAVISTDCVSGPREILGDNEYGLLFDVGDKDTLLKNLELFLNNQDLRDKYVQIAKQRSYAFSVKKIIQEYKKVLNENSNIGK